MREVDPQGIADLNNEASAYKARGDFHAAKGRLQTAVALCREGLGDEHSYTLVCISNLGDILNNIGDFVAARELLEPALPTAVRVLGEEDLDALALIHNLGNSYRESGDPLSASA